MSDSETPETETILRTPGEVRETVQQLLRSGFVSSDEKPQLFTSCIRLQLEITEVLEPLDLRIRLDEARGLAILIVAESAAADADEAWSHPLVKALRLTLEQSLLVAILRQIYVLHEQDAGIGVSTVRLPAEDLSAQLTSYLGDSGSDTKNEQRLLRLLDQLKQHGIVTPPDKNQEITIRPLITCLANPETLTALLAQMRSLSTSKSDKFS